MNHSIGAATDAGGVPIYVRLAASLRTRIFHGEWAKGERLPPLEEIATRYGVAINTVRSAIQLLVTQAILTTGRGRGTTVTATSDALAKPDARAAMNDPLVFSPHHSIEILSSSVVDKLSDDLSGEYETHRHYQGLLKTHSFRNMPYGLVKVFIDLKSFKRFPPGSEKTSKTSLLLRDYGKAAISLSRQELTVVHADQHEAELLRYPVAAPLVRVRRWHLDTTNRVIYACTVLYRSDTFVWDVTESHPQANHLGDQIMPDLRVD